MKATTNAKGEVDYAQFNSFKNVETPTLEIRDPRPDQNIGRTISYGNLTIEIYKTGKFRFFENGRMVRASW